MTNETIGKCECIYPTTKVQLLGALDIVIAQEDEKIDYYTFRKNEKEKGIHSSIKRNFEDVRIKVANTPECITHTLDKK